MQPAVDTETSKDMPSLRERLVRRLAVIGGLVLAGLLVLPALIYVVGRAVFGEYGGGGFAAFYAQLHENLRDGQPAAIFLLLSPCIVWLLAGLTIRLFRRLGGRSAEQS